MNQLFKTKAYVLTKKNWKENDLLFSFYTEEFGKIEAVATGARKITSKLVGPLSSQGVIELLFVKGKTHNKVTHTYILESTQLNELENYYYISALKEIMNKFVAIEVESKTLWVLSLWFFESLFKAESKDTKRLLFNVFMIRFIQNMGYEFKIDVCVKCGKSLESVRRFSYVNKGFVCANCHGGELLVKQSVFDAIKKIQAEDFIKELKMNKKDNLELFEFARKTLQYFFEKEIKSLNLI
jgi:DNA repair protein RecO (recombination protein O)